MGSKSAKGEEVEGNVENVEKTDNEKVAEEQKVAEGNEE
jgi:hypothetical protein